MIREQLLYTNTHEWFLQNKNSFTYGLTKYRVKELGKLLYLDLPKVGDEILAGISFGEIESLDELFDLIMPLSGEVVAVNERLYEKLEVLSEDPYGKGWLIKFVTDEEHILEELLSAQEYTEKINQLTSSSKQKQQKRRTKTVKGKQRK